MLEVCRCSVAAWEDSEDYDAWLDYLSKGGTTEEWNRLQKAEKSVAKKQQYSKRNEESADKA